jgi:hypothetical protein
VTIRITSVKGLEARGAKSICNKGHNKDRKRGGGRGREDKKFNKINKINKINKQ